MSRQMIKGLKLKNQGNKLNASDIAQAIEQGLLSQRRPSKPFTQKKTFSPSSIGYGHGTCARFWFIAFSGTDSWQDDVDSMGVANMGVGAAVHDYLQETLKASGMVVEDEVEIKLEDPPVRGYLDAIVKWNDENLVCEIKTTREDAFSFRQMSGKPMTNHLIQILLYLKATGLKRGFLLYVNKNDQTMLVIPVELNEANEALINEVLEWLRTARAAFDNNDLPIIPFVRARNSGEPSNKICRSCPVQKDCFNKEMYGEGVVDIPLMEVPKL